MNVPDDYKSYDYNGTEAYELFETALPKQRPAQLPEEKPIKQPKYAPKAKPVFAPLAVVGLIVVMVLLMLVVHSYVQLYEASTRVGELEQSLSAAQTNTAKLRSTYESRIDLAKIEARARELGMSQPSPRQMVYLNIPGADHAEVIQVDRRNYPKKILDAIVSSFQGVLEYFR